LVPLLKSNTFIEEVMLNVEEESTKESVDSLRKEILEEERSFDFKGLIT